MEITTIGIIVIAALLIYLIIKQKSAGGPMGDADSAAKIAALEAEKNALSKSLAEEKSAKQMLEQKINELSKQSGELENHKKQLEQKLELSAEEAKKRLNEQLEQQAKTYDDRIALIESKHEVAVEQAVNAKDIEIGQLTEKIESARKYYTSLKEQFDALKTESEKSLQYERELRQKDAENIEKLKKEVSDTFKAVMAENVKQSSKEVLELAQDRLKLVLQPVEEFKKKVEEQIKEGKENKGSLETYINTLKQSAENLNVKAENLAEALRGNRKMLGNWGEIQLMQILENAGLKEGTNFEMQKTVNSPDGKRYIYDAIVKLPDQKSIIIDSKVSLENYLNFIASNNEVEQTEFLSTYVSNIRSHIDGLSSKSYVQSTKGAFEYVVMFLPIETAFIAACNHDQTLWQYGYNKKVILVTPSTLMATLLVVANIWRQENRNKNAAEIAQIATKIYDKFTGFADDFVKIKESIAKLQVTYDNAEGKLIRGNGNIVTNLDRMKKLGLDTGKKINEKLLNDTDNLQLQEPDDEYLGSDEGTVSIDDNNG